MKRSVIFSVVALAAVAMMGSVRLAANDDDDRHDRTDRQRIEQGFRIAPVHLNLRGKDPELVGLGSYLVNG
jgi:hypothetical protein